MSEVIKGFYNHDWDILMLMRKYGEEIKNEQRKIREMEREARKVKRKKRMRRR
ncbi:hypothetical protein [Methanobrevibacter sp.]|uniref:hypothetical protein n=1 Tax=Methanobrevibacter sp. TaxID=66852 RepID=UPI00388FF10F